MLDDLANGAAIETALPLRPSVFNFKTNADYPCLTLFPFAIRQGAAPTHSIRWIAR
jgi:hypothetical protein